MQALINSIKPDPKQEMWKTFGQYKISSMGRVKRNKILKLYKNRGGYLQFSSSNGGKITYHRIHRLVAQFFVPNSNNKPHVNHKDGNKLNNNSSNLEWCTKQENEKHALINGLIPRGEMRSNSKLTWEKVKEIRKKYIARKYGRVKLSKEYNVSEGVIQRILNNISWKIYVN